MGIKNAGPASAVMATARPRALRVVLFLHPRQREMLWGRDPTLSGSPKTTRAGYRPWSTAG